MSDSMESIRGNRGRLEEWCRARDADRSVVLDRPVGVMEESGKDDEESAL